MEGACEVDGELEGLDDGCTDGLCDSVGACDAVGVSDGLNERVGEADGPFEGVVEGAVVAVGDEEGESDGAMDGIGVGGVSSVDPRLNPKTSDITTIRTQTRSTIQDINCLLSSNFLFSKISCANPTLFDQTHIFFPLCSFLQSGRPQCPCH